MSLDKQQLLDLKEKVENAKTSVSQLTGQKQALLKQLKDEWQCKTIEEAEKKLKTINSQIETLDLQIEEGVIKLTEKYNLELTE